MDQLVDSKRYDSFTFSWMAGTMGIGEGATEDTNYHEVWTVKPLIYELSPLGGVGWLAVAWAK